MQGLGNQLFSAPAFTGNKYRRIRRSKETQRVFKLKQGF
jgi:hypothetical protein